MQAEAVLLDSLLDEVNYLNLLGHVAQYTQLCLLLILLGW